MSDTSTTNFIDAYYQDAEPTMFLTGLFQTPERNFYATEGVEIDIVRSGEKVAIPVQDLSAGYRKSEAEIFTNKRFVPPVYKNSFGLESSDLVKRYPGQNPFQNSDYRANIIRQMFRKAKLEEDKIRRAKELQASQVMQTGTATLVDANGNNVFNISYSPKATHFPTAGTAWDAGGDVIGDLLSLANVIRNDGLGDPSITLWGEDAYEAALGNADFKARFDNRRIDTGSIMMMTSGGTATANYRGTIDIGNFKLEIWTYGARYEHPQTSTVTQYLDPGKVVMLVPGARLDATFGAVPHVGRELGIAGQAILPELPGRFSSSGARADMFMNVWLSENGEQLFGGVACRPLLIPTAIDKFGCIDSGV